MPKPRAIDMVSAIGPMAIPFSLGNAASNEAALFTGLNMPFAEMGSGASH
jgi:hypothetical protein